MATPTSGKTYRFTNVGAPTRRLNLYSSGSASNGMNVVLYTSDSTNEQQWTYSNSRLLIKTNTAFCLDRYNLSGNANHNNADIWTVSSSEDANQKIAFEDYGSYVKIKLSSTALYLTAYSNANGNGSGKTKESAGNVYWASADNKNELQKWTFAEVTGGGTTPSETFCWPTESTTVVRWNNSTHDGVDIAPKKDRTPGDKVYAYMDGYVAMTGTPSSNPKEGYTVRIHHVNPLNNGYSHIRTQYMHLRYSPLVSTFNQVKAGQLIGYMGNTGNVSPVPTETDPWAGTHLHFEVRGGTSTQFPLGGKSSDGFNTGTVLLAKNYLDLT